MVLGMIVGSPIEGFGPAMLYCGLIGGLGGCVFHLGSRVNELEAARKGDAAAGPHAEPGTAVAGAELTASDQVRPDVVRGAGDSATAVARDAGAMDAERPPGPAPFRAEAEAETEDDLWGQAANRPEAEPESEPAAEPAAVDRVIAAVKRWFTTATCR